MVEFNQFITRQVVDEKMEDEYAQYKHFHGLFMEHNNGTTFAETVTVLMPVPLGVILISLILKILSLYMPLFSENLWFQFLMEFSLLVLPLLLNLTVFSGFVYALVIIMCLVVVILFVPFIKVVWRAGSMLLSIPVKAAKQPYITNFRSSVNLTTCLCILAVDFAIFPRRFAKTESFGFSLMDVGVGGFIFTNAIVAREARAASRSASFRTIWKAVLSSLPLSLLGLARLVSVHSLDYYVNIAEYGIHWNFFFTLAVCKVMCTLLLSVFTPTYAAFLSFSIITFHELFLASGIQDWVLSTAPRDNFFSANREGIISCAGYVSLYLAGVHAGRLLHSKRVFLRDFVQLAVELLLASLLFSSVGGFVHKYLGVSRRLANFGYFFLTIAYNLIFLFMFLLMELLTVVFEYSFHNKFTSKTTEDKQVTPITFVPAILSSISSNGLLFFMIANLLTGLVNLYIRTIHVSVLKGSGILTLYTFLLCSIIVILHAKQIHVKVW